MTVQQVRERGVCLAGPRVMVRTPTVEDGDALAWLMHTDAVLRQDLGFPDPPPGGDPPPGAGAGFIESIEAWCARTTSVSLAIVGPAGDAIGLISLSHLEPDRHCAKIGYWLGSQSRRQGYATEAFALVLELARSLGLEQVRGTVRQDNAASWRLWAHDGRMEQELDGGRAVWLIEL